VAHPVAIAPRSRVLEGLVLEVVPDHFQRSFGFEDLGCARRFDSAARVDRDGRRAALDTLRQQFHERPLVILTQQRAEILHELRARRGGGMQSRPSGLAGRRQLDPVGRKPIAHQPGAYALRDPVLVEHGE